MGAPRSHNPGSVPAPIGGFSLGMDVDAGARCLLVSGQIPEDADGGVPEGFRAQCELAWRNVLGVLESADMGARNLVKVTTFLTHTDQAEANSEVRRRMLGDAHPALTVVVVATLDPRWLLEIEAVAAA